jgi:hypothetical protein
MAKINIRRKTAARISPASKARIVELSLQHPEFGAKRLLPLLKKESIAITVSSIYNVLKHNGLQNREKRFAKIRAQQALEDPQRKAADIAPPAAAPHASPEIPRSTRRPQAEDRRTTTQMDAGKAPLRRTHRDFKGPAKNKVRIPLALKLVGAALFFVLAFSGVHRALKVRRTRSAPLAAAAAVQAPAPVHEAAAEIVAVTPAGDSATRKGDLPDADSPPEVFTNPPLPTGVKLPPYLSSAAWPVDSPWSFTIGLEEVEAWLADARRLWQEATLDPYMKDDFPAGFTITGLQPDAIYVKMGLQNGDVIQGVNGEPIVGPEEAVYFFQRIAEGGVAEIRIKRHRRTRYISLTIQ